MTEIFSQILTDRGLDESFLNPRYEDLFDPFLMLGMNKAVERIERARDEAEHILIYGDYDADGVTSSTVLVTALKDFGCEDVQVILPNRFIDGYGMKDGAIEEIAARGINLVITVDNGSGSGGTIEKLKERGIDTIVTDHHEIPNKPEAAVAVINPRLPGEKYGLRMAGVGVAFTLARALNMRKNGGSCDGQEKWLLDLVTLGTICDSMVLRDENRIFTYFGLKVFPRTRRRGIKELAQRAGVKLDEMNGRSIGFQLGPRINAAGRMKSADLALDLMMTDKRAEAYTLAEELDELNSERRRAQDSAVKEANLQVNEKDSVIVVHGKWHEGIVGIVAGRLVEIYKKPAIVFAELEDGVLKGSGRSFGDFSLAEALLNMPEGLLLSGGGHAAACGLSLVEANLEDFRNRINDYYAGLGLTGQERYLRQVSDVILGDFSKLSLELCDEIQQMEPFGEGNQEPIFEITATVKAVRVLKEEHLSLTLKDRGGLEFRLMGFYAPDEWLGVKAGQDVLVQFTLTKNEWGGNTKLEGIVISLETSRKI